jgi:hypothetical protein
MLAEVGPREGLESTVQGELTSQERHAAGPVLVTSTCRWASAPRMAMGLSEAGFEVSVLEPPHGPSSKTHAVRRTFHYSGLRPLKSLEAAIRETQPRFVIPCDDRATQHLHELHKQAVSSGESSLVDLIEQSLGSPQGYSTVMSRSALLEAARDEGLRTPDTFAVGGMEDLTALRSRLPFPWVLKADGTWGGSGVRIARDEDQAKQHFLQMTQMFRASRMVKRLLVNRDAFVVRSWWNHARPNIVAQSYVPGRPANCAVVCWRGEVLAGIAAEVVSAAEATGTAAIVRVVDSPEMMRCAQRLAALLGVSGFFGLDFMIEEKSGNIHLIEMNPRCTPLCHLRLGPGRDMLAALAAQLGGQTVSSAPAVTDNDLIAYFPQAWTLDRELLESSFQDAPWGEHDLLEELKRPWPDRSLLVRMATYLSRTEASESKPFRFVSESASEITNGNRPERRV